MIDEMRVWNDKRTATEIQANRCNRLQGNEPNLVGCWEFDQTLLDKTSNNNHLTNVNGVSFSTDVPVPDCPTPVARTTWSDVKDFYRK